MTTEHNLRPKMDDDVQDDVDLVISQAKPNALLEGPDVEIAVLLASIWPRFTLPVARWCGGGPLPPCGTLVIPNVERLDRGQQQQLQAWLQEHPQVQVISTSTVHVFGLVTAGDFLSDLFYQLNAVRVVIQPRYRVHAIRRPS